MEYLLIYSYTFQYRNNYYVLKPQYTLVVFNAIKLFFFKSLMFILPQTLHKLHKLQY